MTDGADISARLRAAVAEHTPGISISDVLRDGAARQRILRRRRTTLGAAGVVAAITGLAVGLAVGLPTSAGSSSRLTPEAPASPSAPGTSPSYPTKSGAPASADYPLDVPVSWVGTNGAFALNLSACAAPCVRLRATTDGGSTWHDVAGGSVLVPGSDPSCTLKHPNPACVSQLLFTSAIRGYAYKPGLMQTTDGGQTWTVPRPADGPATADRFTDALAPDGMGGVWRLSFASTGCPGPCDEHFEHLGAQQDRWQTVNTSVGGAKGTGIIVNGQRLVVTAYGNPAGGVRPSASLAVSDDSGATFQAVSDPCTDDQDYASQVFWIGPAIGVECSQAHDQVARAYLLVSHDDGLTFPERRQLPGEGGLLASSTNGTLVQAATLYTQGQPDQHRVSVSSDDGAIWTATKTYPNPRVYQGEVPGERITWTSASTLDWSSGSALWHSTDSGQTWSALTSPFATGLHP